MDDTALGPRKDLGKNLIIALLLLITAVQTGLLLLRGPAEHPSEAGDLVAVTSSHLDAANRRELLLAFDAPLAANRTDAALAPAPASISPDIPGNWFLVNPYCLRFRADAPFKLQNAYTVTLDPKALLKPGQRFDSPEVQLRTGGFEVQKISLSQQPAPGGQTLVSIKGKVRFNIPVDPRTLLKHIELRDPNSETPVPLSVTARSADRTLFFQSAAVNKTFEPRDLTLTVDRTLTPHNGNLRLGRDASASIRLALSPFIAVAGMSGESMEGLGRITIQLSTPVDPDRAARGLSVSPKTEFAVSADADRLILSGKFEPGRVYKVALAAGLKSVDGATLKDRFERPVEMPDLPSSASFESPGMFLSRRGTKNLVLKSVNTDQVRLTVDRVWENNIFPLFAEWQWRLDDSSSALDEVPSRLGDRLADTLLDVPETPNKAASSIIPLDAYLPKNAPGFYKIGTGLPGDYQGDMRWVLVTDIGLAVKRTRGRMLVFAASFEDAAPLSGVRLSLMSGQNQVLASGTSDRDGLARFTFNEGEDTGAPFMILARKGQDFSFLVLDRSRSDTTGLDVGGRPLSSEGYTTFLYGERDIYRPGETVQGMAVVRDARLQAPGPMPLKLRTLDPSGRDLGSVRLDLNARGIAPFSVSMPDFASTGTYTFELLAGNEAIGQYRCQVEEFVPDRISVDVRPDARTAGPGQALSYQVLGRYLFGPPASDLPVETRAFLVSEPFAPKGYADYVFGDPDREFKAMEIFSKNGMLDQNGTCGFTLDIPQGLTPPAALSARLTARVSEQGGRGVTAIKPVTVHAYPLYPGLKLPDRQGYDPGRPITFHYVALSPDGLPASHAGLAAELYQDRWQTVVRETPEGGFRYESVRDPRLEASLALPAGVSRGEFSFTPPDYGSWRVVLTDPATGAASSVSFYTGGWGYSPWALENPARIELVADKEEYAPGETATIQVRAPFPGRLLVTVEGDEVFTAKVLELKGNTASVSVPVKKEYAPNVYVAATLVRGAKDLAPGTTARALGAVSLNVDRLANDLKPVVEAPETMRPHNLLTVRARTAPGADVTFAVVDEGILQLIAQKTPNPFGHFYAKRSLGVSWYDIFAMLLPEVKALGASPAGGGMGLEGPASYMGADSIRRTKPVAFWSGPLTADANGVVTFEADIPDFQGALRVMCVALDGRRFGASQATVRVRSPLSLTPTFPEFLAMEENLLVPVTVRNDTPENGDFAIRLDTEGPLLVREPERRVSVETGRQRTIWFPVETLDREGPVRFTASGSGNGETFATSGECAIRSALPREHMAVSGSFAEPRTEFPADLPTRPVNSTLKRSLRIGRLPVIRFSGNLRSLLEYPYGCMEQTVSKAFPLLYFNDLAQTLDPDLFAESSPASMVRRGIRKLRGAQLPDGGFPLWPSGSESWPWVSVYATHFLAEARSAGYQVGDYALSQALNYCRSQVWPVNPDQADLRRAAYALYVLARAGQADAGSMDHLRDNYLKHLPPDSAALLAAAYGAAGDPQGLRSVLGAVDAKKAASTGRSTGGDFNSPVRELAITLLALLEAAPDDPLIPGTATRLTDALGGDPTASTQENAFALLALGRFFARQDLAGPFAGTVSMNGEILGRFTDDAPLVLDGIPGAAPITVSFDQGFQPGGAFYALHTRYVPVMEDYRPVENGLAVKRRFLDRNGAPLDPSNLIQGDLVAMATSAKSFKGTVDNVAVVALLPPGLEVENPRLSSKEVLPWMSGKAMESEAMDLRRDRVILFTDLYDEEWTTSYALFRAVTAGNFTLPPVRAEAMYDPSLKASTQAGTIRVTRPEGAREVRQ